MFRGKERHLWLKPFVILQTSLALASPAPFCYTAPMARKLRVQYPGAIYHVMSRGDHSDIVFRDTHDHDLFLGTLAEACGKTDWQVHTYCLMCNHFHLVIETPRANLVAGMKWLLTTYTCRFNRKHKLFGHLFSGRYKALPVDGSTTGYLKTACDYVHLNPVRAQLLVPEQPLQAYPWSSYPLYLKEPTARPVWLRTDRLLGEWGIPMDSAAGREQFARAMEGRRRSEQAETVAELPPCGWCVGSEEFRQQLLQQMTALPAHPYGGAEWQETAEKKARRILVEELRRCGWEAAELQHRRKGDPDKIRIARRLRAETTMTLAWIAKNLSMGAPGSLANCLRNNQP
jgi:putative transposase